MAQNLANIWYFGENAGLDFNKDTVAPLTNGKLDTYEGTATICDSIGQILFYTDGVTVFNRNHDTMLNGSGLLGDQSSGQSALIIKVNERLYYITTTTSYSGNDAARYSVVDMALDNGNGAVTSKNIKLFDKSNERQAAIQHENGRDYWLVMTQNHSNTIYLYLVSASGISLHNTIYLPAGKDDFGRGAIKFSNKGSYLAFAADVGIRQNNFILLYDFNTSTGVMSNPRSIDEPHVYGLEFSPNEKYLYFVDYYSVYGEPSERRLYQCPVDSIKNASIKKTHKTLLDSKDFKFSSLQLGPDGKIYGSHGLMDPYVYVILRPNLEGVLCSYQGYAKELQGRPSRVGLPSFVQSYIYREHIEANKVSCTLQSQVFKLRNTEYDSIHWNFGGVDEYASQSDSISHQFKSAGNYIVTATVYLNGIVHSIVKDSILVHDIQRNFLPNDTLLCEGDTLNLTVSDPSIDVIYWNQSGPAATFMITSSMQVEAVAKNNYCSSEDTMNVYFVNCTFEISDTCFGDSTTVSHTNSNADSAFVNWGDEIINYRLVDTSINHAYKLPKEYAINLLFYKSGLSVSKSKRVNIWKVDVPNLGSDVMFCDSTEIGPQTILSYASYLWNTGATKPTITVTNDGLYFLQVSLKSCQADDSINVHQAECRCEVYIPNVFRPNYDGRNDYFRPVSQCDFLEYELTIYNRWGELIFNSSDINTPWDGMVGNQAAHQSVYFYMISGRLSNQKLINYYGTVHLLD